MELGELLLSLNYLPSAGRLNVDVIRAKQLLQTDVSQGSGMVWPLPFPVSFNEASVYSDPIFFLGVLGTINKTRPRAWLTWASTGASCTSSPALPGNEAK